MPWANPRTVALYWLAVELDTNARALLAASSDPAVPRVARIRAEARAEAFREAAARMRTVLKGDQDADS